MLLSVSGIISCCVVSCRSLSLFLYSILFFAQLSIIYLYKITNYIRTHRICRDKHTYITFDMRDTPLNCFCNAFDEICCKHIFCLLSFPRYYCCLFLEHTQREKESDFDDYNFFKKFDAYSVMLAWLQYRYKIKSFLQSQFLSIYGVKFN